MTEAIIRAARAHWGLGDVAITLVAVRENAVFHVKTPDRPAALRLHRRGYRKEDELRFEIQWMAMLAQHGVAVPKPIVAVDGSDILICDGTVVDLLSWLEGATLSAGPVKPGLYFDLGYLVARMHDLADDWTLPSGLSRHTWDLVGDQPTWGRFWENPQLTPEQAALLVTFRDTARTLITGMKNPDIGLIHADLVPDNVLLNGGRLQPIDFDDGGFGHRLFDLATITFRSMRTDPTGALADATVAGYCAGRMLDIGALPLFEALRACTYVGWNIARMDETGAEARNTRFIAAALSSVTAFLSA